MRSFMNVRHKITGTNKMKVLWMLCYFMRQYPVYVVCVFVNELLMALPNYIGNVLFLKYLMQMILNRDSISRMLLLLGGTALFLIASDFYTAWFSAGYVSYAEERIRKDFYEHVKNAAAYCELTTYDDVEFHNEMTYINNNIANDAFSLLTTVSKMTAELINVLLIVHLFYKMGFAVLLFSIVAVSISIAFDVPMIRIQNKKKYAVSCIERKRGYFRDCFFMRETFGERKMTNVNALLYSKYEKSVEEQILCEKRFGRKLFGLNSLKELLSTQFLMQFILIAYLLYQVLAAQTLQKSDFIAAYNAVNVIVNAVMLLVRSWGQLEENGYTVGIYRRFLSSAQGGDGAGEYGKSKNAVKWRKIQSIEFRKVSFAYPGNSKCVLKEISFCIHYGEKIAIVGKNGSGKTTLIHLLMGLYVPTEGEILVNGKILDREEILSYRFEFAAFFQGMKPMEATVAENVALDTKIDSNRIFLALQKTGCDALFSQPERQMVGIQFDSTGLILSGGECQKLLLAHCFYSNCSMLVMDEPSSALDPVLEQAFNRQVRELAEDKLVVFVTHRLSTVHMADMIYVIEDGRLCEKGKHEELISQNGVYGEMWRIQREKYSSVLITDRSM